MPRLSVRFWGVRGSLATPGEDTVRYGGNTACVEVLAGDERLIFDMGSGLRGLGRKMSEAGPGSRATFFLSHYHWDHILGLPFFAPAYDPQSAFVIHGALHEGQNAGAILGGHMAAPYFPVKLSELRASFDFRSIGEGDRVQVGPALVSARALNHPGGALGFRVQVGERSLVYATDFEHGTEADAALVELAADTDLLIYDAMFAPEDYERHRGWGHSTWKEGVRFAQAARARKLMLFHYNPNDTDLRVDALLREARLAHPATDAAREGELVEL